MLTIYIPTTTADLTFTSVNSANGVITGGTGNGQVTLRSAVIAANAAGGTNSINLSTGHTSLPLSATRPETTK